MKKTHYRYSDKTLQMKLIENYFGYRVIIKNRSTKEKTSIKFDDLNNALSFFDLSIAWRQKLCNEYPFSDI